MKLLCGPDLHIRVSKPKFRTDDFVKTQEHKMRFIWKTAGKQGCQYILLPGDITDHDKLPFWIIVKYAIGFRENWGEPCEAPLVVGVKGQHDLIHHVNYENTPLRMLEAAGAISVLENDSDGYALAPKIRVWAANWDEDIPDPGDYEGLKILLIHKMFIDDKLWEGQEEFERASVFLRRSKWDLVVSGDNHTRFVHKYKDRWHVNCGSLMREKIDQVHHLPAVYIYDTNDRSLNEIQIPIDPIDEVMNIREAREEKEREEELDAFVSLVSETTEITGLDFTKNLRSRFAQDDIRPGVKRAGEEILKNAAKRLG